MFHFQRKIMRSEWTCLPTYLSTARNTLKLQQLLVHDEVYLW